jgi:hypothetical protein
MEKGAKRSLIQVVEGVSVRLARENRVFVLFNPETIKAIYHQR